MAAASPVDSEAEPAASDELALWQSLRDKQDPAARDALLSRYLPYAKTIAAVMYGRRINREDEFDDYLQLARVGLIEALDRYDPAGGAQFKTFAARRVRGAVLDGITLLSEKHGQIHARRRVLDARAESVAASAAGESKGDLFSYLAEVGMGLALGFMLEETGMFDAGARSSAADPLYSAVELNQSKQRLHGLIDNLSPPERKVIHHHYLQGVAFEDIALEMNLTKGRISQIHKKALARLRHWMAERHACDASF